MLTEEGNTFTINKRGNVKRRFTTVCVLFFIVNFHLIVHTNIKGMLTHCRSAAVDLVADFCPFKFASEDLVMIQP